MALRLIFTKTSFIKAFQNLTISNVTSVTPVSTALSDVSRRNASFFVRYPAKPLWSSVTSVSNAGAKKGRGRAIGKRRSKDLNIGQMIGAGKINMLWPGLSAPIIRGRELVTQQRLPDDPEREAKLIKLRDSMGNYRRIKVHPLERGWSGGKVHGKKIGPPDPVGDFTYEGFETIVLKFTPLMIMRKIGRQRRLHVLAVTGNGNGVAGFAMSKASEAQLALRRAKNRAGQKLMHFDLFNGHTVYHDFFTQFGSTKIFVSKQNEGYGLVCHRALRAICQLIGIKDIHAKVEGPVNILAMTRAFFIGLLQQKTHQTIADEKKLHLVEFRKENEYFPKVVATPTTPVRTAAEIPKDENLDFNLYSWNNRVVLRRKKHPKFYERMPHYEIFLKKQEKRRNHLKIRQELTMEYGECKSFLNYRHPDAYDTTKKE